MTCAQVRDLVFGSGAIVLTTGRYTYDRYVADEHFCPIGYMTREAWIATSDTGACPVGYTCVVRSDREDRWWWLRNR